MLAFQNKSGFMILIEVGRFGSPSNEYELSACGVTILILFPVKGISCVFLVSIFVKAAKSELFASTVDFPNPMNPPLRSTIFFVLSSFFVPIAK